MKHSIMTDSIIETGYNSLEKSINNRMLLMEEDQTIDYQHFYTESRADLYKFIGMLHVLVVQGEIEDHEWNELYDKAYSFVEDAQKRMRKLDLDPIEAED